MQQFNGGFKMFLVNCYYFLAAAVRLAEHPMFGLVYNLIRNVFRRKEYRVLVAGVDGAGKTVRLPFVESRQNLGQPPTMISQKIRILLLIELNCACVLFFSRPCSNR